ncbi:hypothetical protein Hanom_Chr08g00715341 [Helianthus anomalus]
MIGALEGSILAVVAEGANASIWSINWDVKLFAAIYSVRKNNSLPFSYPSEIWLTLIYISSIVIALINLNSKNKVCSISHKNKFLSHRPYNSLPLKHNKGYVRPFLVSLQHNLDYHINYALDDLINNPSGFIYLIYLLDGYPTIYIFHTA